MNSLPVFTDSRGRKIKPPRRRARPLTIQALVAGLAAISVILGIGAATQINLTNQVQGTLAVANGGTGLATITAHGVMIGETTGNVAPTSAGTSGQPLLSGGSGADPNWGTLGASYGGTGQTSLTVHGVVLGESTSGVNVAAASANSQCFMSASSSYATTDPSFQTCPSNPTFYEETPSGTINGSNTTFTLAHTPTSNTSVLVFLNGVMQTQGAGADYTISTTTITYNTAPPTGSVLTAQYH